MHDEETESSEDYIEVIETSSSPTKATLTRKQKVVGASAMIISNVFGFGLATEEYFTNKHLIETNENLVALYNTLVEQSRDFVLECNKMILTCHER